MMNGASSSSDKDFISPAISDNKQNDKSDTIINSEGFTSNDGEVEYYEKTYSNGDDYGDSSKSTVWRRFKDSFKRADHVNTNIHGSAELELNPSQSLVPEKGASLKRDIKKRHVIMMSLATGIGTGLLVGNGKALYTGGPAGLTIGYAIMGSCLYGIIQAAGELAVAYPTLTGNFNNYPSFLVDPALCFATATLYCIQWLCVFPLEIISAAITIQYWNTSINPDVWCVIFYVVIIVINMCGSAGYAEADFFFNTCKVLMFAGFFILGIIINCGGAGNDGYIGGLYWNTPGSFNGETSIARFKAIVSTLVTAAFAFGATESVALTASEQASPRKAIPSAAKQVLYRIFAIYLCSIILIGFLVPYDSSELMGSGSSSVHASPYVIAVASHGVKVVPSIINAVIIISVLSVGNFSYYSSSRILLCLSEIGYAPKFFQYVDRQGRPLYAMIVGALFGCICFVSASSEQETVFTWLLAISGLSQLFTWCLICISHVRFRMAMKAQNRSLGELGFKSQVGVWGSYYGILMMILVLIGQFWVALFPIDGDGKPDAENFFANYLGFPVFLALYFGFKIYKKDWRLFIPSNEVDLISDRKIFDEDILKQEDEEYKLKMKHAPVWKKFADFWC
ncbi:unnamed protein product [Kluyveromyces dobzhanskii CBS 2104]|uniref:WGS project CCBQ000000000 data, contig MAT n=1 Tax=Kluyveromyces dobzhanskii CBS 2104 TaxID=1427455 RepID=A0A0A8L147_9SACH|nr:unnamed protein product [Kluyveromyces dobzhanskii CBS 2104]